MARPTKFDRDEALQSAMSLFWRQGYETTSLQHLLDTMQISRSSFYATFGGKKQLFIEAIKRYSKSYDDTLLAVRNSDDPVAAINLYMSHTLAPKDPNRRLKDGCMIVNTLLEQTDIDSELSQLALRQLSRVEKAFELCFSNAIASRKLDRSHNPRQLARFFMTLNQGLRVSMRGNSSKQQIRSLVEYFISMLDVGP